MAVTYMSEEGLQKLKDELVYMESAQTCLEKISIRI